MKKTLIAFFFVLNITNLFCQEIDPLDFWPHHVGDIWQYRSSFTGELFYTETFTKDTVDEDGSIFIWYNRTGQYMSGAGLYKIDTLHNLFQVYSLIDTADNPLLFKLDADSGETWVYFKTPDDSITAEVVEIIQTTVYGKPETVKKIEYIRHSITFGGSFWLANRYLATGFGIIGLDIEPSGEFYISGALIDSVQYGIITSVKNEESPPEYLDVIINYPNPFNSSTSIFYKISKNSDVNITIYDLLGRVVKNLVNEEKQKGSYEVNFYADDISTGIYFAVLKTDSNILTHKILLLK